MASFSPVRLLQERCSRVLPGLIATACFASAIAASAADEPFRWVVDEKAGTADLKVGDQPVVRYQFTAYDTSTKESLHDTYKVFHHVFGPGTNQIITKGPGGDFTHHRGLYVAWNKTVAQGKSHDFWHCTKGDHQSHVKFLDQQADAKHGSMTAEIHWSDADDKPVIIEQRTVDVKKIPMAGEPGYGWQIDWTTKLTSQRGDIKLDGDRQHAGFQYRADQPVSKAKSARYIRPAEFPQKPEALEVSDATQPDGHINLGWFAMTYPLDDQQYCIQYFEDPALPKPSRYSERPYGRFGAFFSTTLKADEPLVMKYRVLVTTEKDPSRDEIQKRYDAFCAELKAAK